MTNVVRYFFEGFFWFAWCQRKKIVGNRIRVVRPPERIGCVFSFYILQFHTTRHIVEQKNTPERILYICIFSTIDHFGNGFLNARLQLTQCTHINKFD